MQYIADISPLSICLGTTVAPLSIGSSTGRGFMTDNLKDEGAEQQIKGTAKQAEGRIRNAVGGLTGDTSEQLKGKAQDLKGKAQRKLGEQESESDR